MDFKKRILVIAGGTYISGAEKVTLDLDSTNKCNPLFKLANNWYYSSILMLVELKK